MFDTRFPRTYANKAIAFYLIGMILVTMLHIDYAMRAVWFVFGLVEVVGFFYYGASLTQRWAGLSEKAFARKLFQTALIIRVVYVIISYFFYEIETGQPFMYQSADEQLYHDAATFCSLLIAEEGRWIFVQDLLGWMGAGNDISDIGYATYLGYMYFFTGSSVFLVRLFKALLGAWTVVLMYRLAQRNFGESVGRITAVFCMLMPNLIYYCGLHLKECEMVFLTVAFINQADTMLRLKTIPMKQMALTLLIGFVVFSFRTVLGAVAFLAVFVASVMTDSRILSTGKKVFLGMIVTLVLAVAMGGSLYRKVIELWEARGDNQQVSMEWRSNRKGGNQFAKYAGAAVFAPLIFTIPFPTVVETEGQENMRMIHGGNYVKNILSFFTIFALFSLLFSGKWREQVLVLSFTVGYLAVIALSAFAHSERFHQPALAFSLMIAAYGVTQLQPKQKKWFTYWCFFMMVAMIGWNWFKLAGRGMA